MSTEAAVDTTTQEPTENAMEQVAEQGAQQAEAKPDAEKAEGEEEPKKDEAPKKEKTPEDKEIARLRRRVDNLTRRLYQSQAQPRDLQEQSIEEHNRTQQSDSEELRLSRADLQRLIDQRAKELAPTIKQQEAEIEQRRKVVEKLSTDWGKEKFDQLASDLDDALDGLADRSGKPKPATDAIFEADDPAALIEYLTDPENSAEAEAIARMGAVQAIRAVTKLDAKLNAAKKAMKDADRPQRSKAPTPVEPVKSGGSANGAPDPSNTKAWIAWRNKQEGAR